MRSTSSEFPLVTVGIPTYNRPEGLRSALESITRQTYENLEIIVCDNCTDGEKGKLVQEVIEFFSKKDDRIVFHRQTENIGPLLNFAFLAKQANGEYFMWAADDDVFCESFIDECYNAFLDCSDECIAVGAEAQYFTGDFTHKFFHEGSKWYSEDFENCALSRVRKVLKHAYGNMFYSLYKTSLFKNELVLNSLKTETLNEIPFYVASAFLGTRVILQKKLFKKHAPPNVVKFAHWQAMGGYYGFRGHVENLKGYKGLLLYMGMLKKEIASILLGFVDANLCSRKDSMHAIHFWNIVRLKFLIEMLAGCKIKK